MLRLTSTRVAQSVKRLELDDQDSSPVRSMIFLLIIMSMGPLNFLSSDYIIVSEAVFHGLPVVRGCPQAV